MGSIGLERNGLAPRAPSFLWTSQPEEDRKSVSEDATFCASSCTPFLIPRVARHRTERLCVRVQSDRTVLCCDNNKPIRSSHPTRFQYVRLPCSFRAWLRGDTAWPFRRKADQVHSRLPA